MCVIIIAAFRITVLMRFIQHLFDILFSSFFYRIDLFWVLRKADNILWFDSYFFFFIFTRIRCGFWFHSIFIHCSICFAFEITFIRVCVYEYCIRLSLVNTDTHKIIKSIIFSVFCAYMELYGMLYWLNWIWIFGFSHFWMTESNRIIVRSSLNRCQKWSNFFVLSDISKIEFDQSIKRLGCRLPLSLSISISIFSISLTT